MGYGFSAFRLFRLHNEFRLRLVAMRILRAGGFSTNSRRQRAMQRQLRSDCTNLFSVCSKQDGHGS